MSEKMQVAVVGATGYTGLELVRILARHPHVQLHTLSSRSYDGKNFVDVFPNLRNVVSDVCDDIEFDSLAEKADLIFIALPHGEAASRVNELNLRNAKMIDLGADFRLEDPAQYKEWYHLDHARPQILPHAVYGLPEFNKDAIRKARLIANPGCYATCSILSITPLLKSDLVEPLSIIIDAKSGVSGAGRSLALGSHFNECNESIKAYGVTTHRHTPEIEQELSRQSGKSIKISFTPHLVPMNRGILVTAYADLRAGVDADAVLNAYTTAYSHCEFVRIIDPRTESAQLPETRWVKGSNFCDISFRIDQRTGRVIVVGALDNLVKGAAGQAVQNMNLMCGFDENCALDLVPMFP